MIVIEKPSIYMFHKSIVDPMEHLRFFEDNEIEHRRNPDEQPRSNAELISEVAGRLCYWSFDQPRPGGNAAYLDRIKDQRHGSILEHATYGFIFTGISRTLTHELVRHRAGFAFSQLSQRYVDETLCAFVRPIEIEHGTREYNLWIAACEYAAEEYVEIVRNMFDKLSRMPGDTTKTEIRKRARQSARSVLPGCTETKIMVTANARAWRHFLEQRGSEGAEPEIRRLANVVLDVLQLDSPNIFGDYETTPHPDGTQMIRTKFQKV